MRHLSPTKASRVSSVIDQLYAKEKKHTYSKQYTRDESLNPSDAIFGLDRAQGKGFAQIIKRDHKPAGNSTDEEGPKQLTVLLQGQKASLNKVVKRQKK